jgi:hypothetical protein
MDNVLKCFVFPMNMYKLLSCDIYNYDLVITNDSCGPKFRVNLACSIPPSHAYSDWLCIHCLFS